MFRKLRRLVLVVIVLGVAVVAYVYKYGKPSDKDIARAKDRVEKAADDVREKIVEEVE